MSAGQTLRALLNARLTAAAEEIFALFERTIAQFEEELRRSKEENQRKQELLESVLNPRVLLLRSTVQLPSTSPALDPGLDPGLDLDHESPHIKVEPKERRLREEQQLPVPESSAVCVKTEESSLLQQRQTERRQETQGAAFSAEPHLHLQTDGVDDWAPFSCSEAAGDHSNRARGSAAQNSGPSSEHTVNNGDASGTAKEAEKKKHQCSLCQKQFANNRSLITHLRVHSGEKPFICPICGKPFARTSNFSKHIRTHTGEKPYSCLTCRKLFNDKSHFNKHLRLHSGEKPYSCLTCAKSFSDKSGYNKHVRVHRDIRAVQPERKHLPPKVN